MAVLAGGGLWLLWRLRRATPAKPAGPEAALRAMGDLLEELRRASQAMTANLDRRAADLKTLIAEADRRLEALKAATAAPAPDGKSSSDTAPEMQAVFETVYREADAGKPVVDIARETGLNKGAVTLILSLREMQRSPAGS